MQLWIMDNKSRVNEYDPYTLRMGYLYPALSHSGLPSSVIASECRERGKSPLAPLY